MKKRSIFKISVHFTLLIVTLALAFTACKKTDVLTNTIHYNTNQPKDFFEAQPGTDALTNRVMANIKIRNEENEFVQEFAHKYGYPVWNKTLQQEVIKRKHLQAFVQEVTSDTLVYIPLVLEGGSKVNGYILARLSDSIAISYSLAQDYVAYPFTPDNNQSPATKFAVKIMLLNNAVFGTNHFEVNDTRLFCKDTALPERSTVSIIKMPAANGLTTAGVNGLLTQICWDVEIAYYYCGTKDYCRAHGGCDAGHCPTGQCYISSANTSYCEDVWTDEPGGGGASGAPGTGGGGGGTPPHDYPCVPGIPTVIAPTVNPCDPPAPNPGPITPVPIDDDEPDPPCDPYVLALQSDNNFKLYFKHLLTYDLLDPGIESLKKERGFLGLADGTYPVKDGIGAGASINWSNLPLNIKLKGILHSHYKGLNAGPSPDDIIAMAEFVLQGNAADSNFYMGVTSMTNFTSGGTVNPPMLLKIDDFGQFITFARSIAGFDGKDQKLKKKFKYTYDAKFNSADPDEAEKILLHMLKDEGATNAIAVYEGNANCNQWTKLKLNSQGNAATEECF